MLPKFTNGGIGILPRPRVLKLQNCIEKILQRMVYAAFNDTSPAQQLSYATANY